MGEIIHSETHPGSRRSAIVADEGDSVWLYLTVPGDINIAADCWLWNKGQARGRDELRAMVESYRAAGLPLPAPSEVLAAGALAGRDVPASQSIEFRWTSNGEGVAILLDGALSAFIAPGEQRGASRNLVVDGPWGAPLRGELAHKIFGVAPDGVNLHERWSETTRLLRDAARELNASEEALVEFERWLSHNELELALDELEGVANSATEATPKFWKAMRTAALSMDLDDHAARYERLA